MRGVLMAVAACTLAGCGYIGDPMPPALNIPDPVRDLRVVQRGGKLIIDYTAPALTTEALGLTSIPAAELQVGDSVVPIAAPKPGEASHVEMPASQWAGREVGILVTLTGPKGRKSAGSNVVTLQVTAPLSVPLNVKAESHPEGVRVSWSSTAKQFRITRVPEASATVEALEYIDRSVEQGKPYTYTVTATSGASESLPGAAVTVVPQDTFAPAAPVNVTAIAGVSSIEIAWERNTEPDLRSYRVYRDDQVIEAEAAVPSFSDRQITSGQKYRYAVTAIDHAGNESGRSAAIEVTAQ